MAAMYMNAGEPMPLMRESTDSSAEAAPWQVRFSPRQMRVVVAMFLTVVSVPPLVWGLWERFKDVQTTDGGRSYEGGWGIFGTIVAAGSGFILLYFLLISLCISDAAITSMTVGGGHLKAFPPAPRLPSDGEFHHDLRVLQPDLMRYGKFAWKVSMALMNTAFIILTFKSLPERDPKKRLNEARWFIACFEGAAMVCLWCFALFFGLLVRNPGALAGITTMISGFSSLAGLTSASPGRAWDLFQRLSKKGIPTAVALLLPGVTAVFLGGCGLMALNVKLNQVDFVTETAAAQWTLYQWFTLACFVNNLFGMMPDSNEPQIEAIFHFIASTDNDLLWFAVKSKWSQEFRDRFGLFDTTVILATLSSKDVIQLLNKSPWTE